MSRRPAVVAFDVVETLFSLEPIGARLAEAGLRPELMRVWFARLLRDAFALEVAGLFRPFREVAGAALTVLAAEEQRRLDKDARERILAAFGELVPYPDAAPALRMLADGGVRAICLTNGSGATALELLRKAGLDRLVERVLSVDEIQHYKPLWDVYLHAADALAVDPSQLALVSTHGWDIEGARQAGLTTGWVQRDEGFSPLWAKPDVQGHSLPQVIEQLLALPRTAASQRPPTETLH